MKNLSDEYLRLVIAFLAIMAMIGCLPALSSLNPEIKTVEEICIYDKNGKPMVKETENEKYD